MDFDSVSSTDDSMCLGHISDPHLLRHVASAAKAGECVFCEAAGLTPIGAVVNLEPLARVVEAYASRRFNHEGVFVDGEQVLDEMETGEVVADLLSDCIDEAVIEAVCERIAGLILYSEFWFEAWDMDYDAGVQFEWDDFQESVKHESRLLSVPEGETARTSPEKNYAFVRSMLVLAEERARLVDTWPIGTYLYRARIERNATVLLKMARAEPAKQLGPAPADRVPAGRMNAQGVSMLYAARDAETACAEVALHSPYDEPVVGTFVLRQSLRILDLTRVPPPRSVFDESWEEGDDRLGSLAFYTEQITRPVILDDNQAVDYVPSQLLTEAFRWWTNPRLDGIAFPSKVKKGGVNIVLFFDSRWFADDGAPVDDMTRHERALERATESPIATIEPGSVKRCRVTRAVSVDLANGWMG